jgi:hypothetical protein
MKRWIIVALLILVLAVTLAGTALAQTGTPPTADTCQCGGMSGMMMQGGGMRGGDARGGRGMPEWAGMDDAAEKLLGMTQAEIQAARLAGKSLVELAQTKGVSKDALIRAILDEHKADLAKLVVDGKMTQAQADAMISRMQEQVKLMVERTGTGPMWQNQPGQGQGQPNSAPMMQRQGSQGGQREFGRRGGGMMGQRGSGVTR